MIQIAVLTPDPADPSYAGQWPGVLDRLTSVLAGGGIEVIATPWSDHVEDGTRLAQFPLVLAVIAWGYHRDHQRWMRATHAWGEAMVRIANPASVLGWNSDKTYLRGLAERGIPIAPTFWTDGLSPGLIDQAFEAFGDTLIVKPTISAGAYRTLKLSKGDAIGHNADISTMIQPYLKTIETEGELSLLFFGGQFSHAVNKRPVDGDFRIQVQYGGRYSSVSKPDEAALALAHRVLAVIDEPLLYARIDMVRDDADQWLLMEAELIEPDFYLDHAPGGGTAFVAGVRERLDRD